MREARARRLKPYEASRRAAGSYLSRQGVSPAVIAAWLGHSDPVFSMKTYVHARPEDLASARDALARKIAKEEMCSRCAIEAHRRELCGSIRKRNLSTDLQ